MKVVGLTIALAAALLAVVVPASGEDDLRFETADWVLTAPAALGTQVDLELNGRQVQLCEDQIEQLVGHRPTNVRKFTMTWVVDGNPPGSYATPTGVVNHVPDVSWMLVSPESRTYREEIVNRAICVGPHEVTHVLTWESWGPAWANEGFATFTDQLYGLHGPDSWSCCTGPLPSYQRCDESGYTEGPDRHVYQRSQPIPVRLPVVLHSRVLVVRGASARRVPRHPRRARGHACPPARDDRRIGSARQSRGERRSPAGRRPLRLRAVRARGLAGGPAWLHPDRHRR